MRAAIGCVWMVAMTACVPQSNGWGDGSVTGATGKDTVVSADERVTARTSVRYGNLSGIEGLRLSPVGDRVYVDMSTYTCSITEFGSMDVDVDVSSSNEVEDEDLAWEADEEDEGVVGVGDGSEGWVATEETLHEVDPDTSEVRDHDIPGVVEVLELDGAVYVLQRDGHLRQMVDGQTRWRRSLDGAGEDMAVWGGQLLVAGRPSWRVDAEGTTRSLDLNTTWVEADPISEVLLAGHGEGFVVYDAALERLWSHAPTGFRSAGVLPGKDLVWVHEKTEGSNRVALYDTWSGKRVDTWPLKAGREHVVVSADGSKMALAGSRVVEMWRIE